MGGLVSPATTTAGREMSYEFGTPGSNFDDIPIDPALVGPPMEVLRPPEPVMVNGEQPFQEFYHQPGHHFDQINTPEIEMLEQEQDKQRQQQPHFRQYNDGPQGDPFAPPPPSYFGLIPIDDPAPSPRPQKRKRKVRREQECGHCQGTETTSQGVPELLLTCQECGRSGHISCLHLEKLRLEVLLSYDWNCSECKTCEVCSKKGNEDLMLFCDSCDRGWHMDCLEPALDKTPESDWFCPQCLVIPPPPEELEYHATKSQSFHELGPPSMRESSVASSSRSHQPPPIPLPSPPPRSPTKSKGKGKGKARAIPTDDSEAEVAEVEVEVEEGVPTLPPTSRPRLGRPPKNRALPESSSPVAPTPPKPRGRPRLRPPSPVVPKKLLLHLPAQKRKGKEPEGDTSQKGMFDDILTEDQRDVSLTSITPIDQQRFDRSRKLAEDKLAPPRPSDTEHDSDQFDQSFGGSSSRPLRSAVMQHIMNAPSESPGPSTPGGYAPPPPPGTLRIRTIRFGPFDIQTWYDAPFPEDYSNIPDGRMWICEFCLRYMKSKFSASRHRMKCKARHPPGDEIYRDGAVSIFEVDGRKNKIYCQNLCLLSKMFLDHKSLFYDVEPFLFYVITEVDDVGARFVGYFSKEKRSPKDYNVSCIMTLPVRQRQGWGNLLIDFSYLLSKKEQRLGSPEKPLSALGALGYKNYWTLAVMRYLETAPDSPRLEDISFATSMTIEDVYNTLDQQNMISASPATPPPVRPSPGQAINKNARGRKSIARRNLQRQPTQDNKGETTNGPFIAPTHYKIRWDRDQVAQYLRGWEAKGYLRLKAEKLKWSPFLTSMMKKTEAAEATETSQLATTSALNGNGHLNGHSPATGTPIDDPVNSLFDDEDVLPVSGISARKAKAQVERDRLLAQELATTPGRRLRSQSMRSPTPTPTRRSARIPTSSPSSPPPRMEEEEPAAEEPLPPPISVPPKKSRGRPKKDPSLPKPVLDEAVRAALEEQSNVRQLRSGQEIRTPVPRSNSLSKHLISSRKRRRIESSPEDDLPSAPVVRLETPPPPPPLPPLPPPIHPETPPIQTDPPPEDQPSAQTELGSFPTSNQDDPHPATKQEERSVSAVPDYEHDLAPVHDLQYAAAAGTLLEVVQTDAISVQNDSAPSDIQCESGHEVVGQEVKSEDMATPGTSRHSAPSDDTLIHSEPVEMDGMLLDSKEATTEMERAMGAEPVMVIAEDSDEDADGDYDPDYEIEM